MEVRVCYKTYVIFALLFSFLFIGCTKAFSPSTSKESKGTAPEKPEYVDPHKIPVERLALIGQVLVYATKDPDFSIKKKFVIGKSQCALCHTFLPGQKADRAPVLIGVEARSHGRVKEDRYKMFAARHAKGEPNSGIKPHAQTGGEYILESEYCPACYIPEGFGIKGTNDMESPMPIMNKPPVSLTDFELVAIAAYLQSKDTPGDYSKITALEDWEHYFEKKLEMTPEDKYLATHLEPSPARDLQSSPKMPVALASDTPEEIVQKMVCFACHKIPGLSKAKTGMIGPLLIMKTNAPLRIKSPEYQRAVKEGKAHATTPREYVMESIRNPGTFIVPGFADDMIKDYSHKFTLAGFDKLVDYLMEQDEAAALKDGLDRLPNEKEGSLLNRSNPILQSR